MKSVFLCAYLFFAVFLLYALGECIVFASLSGESLNWFLPKLKDNLISAAILCAPYFALYIAKFFTKTAQARKAYGIFVIVFAFVSALINSFCYEEYSDNFGHNIIALFLNDYDKFLLYLWGKIAVLKISLCVVSGLFLAIFGFCRLSKNEK